MHQKRDRSLLRLLPPVLLRSPEAHAAQAPGGQFCPSQGRGFYLVRSPSSFLPFVLSMITFFTSSQIVSFSSEAPSADSKIFTARSAVWLLNQALLCACFNMDRIALNPKHNKRGIHICNSCGNDSRNNFIGTIFF